MNTENSATIAVALTTTHEDHSLVRRCLDMAVTAFGGSLRDIIVIDNSASHHEWLGARYQAHMLEPVPGEPIFVRMQRFVDFFLNSTDSQALVKIDPDTAVLKWDGRFPTLAGEMLHYHPRHQEARWRAMPEWWRQQNQDFIRPQYMHGIHGGYAWYSREVCEMISPLFCGYSERWDPETLRTGKLKESQDIPSMIGEEHMFAWYMKQKKIPGHYFAEVSMCRRKYYTYRATVDKIPEPGSLHVFHPVKTEPELERLLQNVSVSSTVGRPETSNA